MYQEVQTHFKDRYEVVRFKFPISQLFQNNLCDSPLTLLNVILPDILDC